MIKYIFYDFIKNTKYMFYFDSSTGVYVDYKWKILIWIRSTCIGKVTIYHAFWMYFPLLFRIPQIPLFTTNFCIFEKYPAFSAVHHCFVVNQKMSIQVRKYSFHDRKVLKRSNFPIETQKNYFGNRKFYFKFTIFKFGKFH